MTATLTKLLRKHIFLHPADRHRRQNAIKAALLKDKKKHSDRLGGALLDVNSLKVVGDKHLVVDGYLSMEVIADVQVFAPAVGMKLDGVINKCSKMHVGCLVMETFNAMLSLPKRSSLKPQIGDTVTFQVSEVVVDDEILFLRGQLKSIKSSVSDLAAAFKTEPDSIEDNENSFFDKQMSKINGAQENGTVECNEVSKMDQMDSSVLSETPTKSKKRKREDSSGAEETPNSPKKKHKRKKT